MQTAPEEGLRLEGGGIEAPYVAPLETDLFDCDEDALRSRDIFPATHPPTDERVDRLTEAGERRHGAD